MSAENVCAAPTVFILEPLVFPNTDLISETPNVVTAIATLVFSIPSITKFSSCTNSPSTSYTDKEVVLVAASFKNAVAPLYLPLI